MLEAIWKTVMCTNIWEQPSPRGFLNLYYFQLMKLLDSFIAFLLNWLKYLEILYYKTIYK